MKYILTRRLNESILVGTGGIVTVIGLHADGVVLTIDFPDGTEVLHGEDGSPVRTVGWSRAVVAEVTSVPDPYQMAVEEYMAERGAVSDPDVPVVIDPRD